jgi:hemerythrin-like domain-containing protein
VECTVELRGEHDLLKRVLEALRRAAETVASGGRPDERLLVGFSDFAQGFVYRCHQLKEDHLFHILEDAGLSRKRAPLAALLGDHEDGLDNVIAMFKALPGAGRGDPVASARLAENAAAYCDLQRSHMEAEDFVFEFSESVLSDADDRSAVGLFRGVEKDLGEDVVRRYHALAEELARGPDAPAGPVRARRLSGPSGQASDDGPTESSREPVTEEVPSRGENE